MIKRILLLEGGLRHLQYLGSVLDLVVYRRQIDVFFLNNNLWALFKICHTVLICILLKNSYLL